MTMKFSWSLISGLQVTEESIIDNEYELDLVNTANGIDNVFLQSSSESGKKTNSNVGDYLPSPTKSNTEESMGEKNQFIDSSVIFSLFPTRLDNFFSSALLIRIRFDVFIGGSMLRAWTVLKGCWYQMCVRA